MSHPPIHAPAHASDDAPVHALVDASGHSPVHSPGDAPVHSPVHAPVHSPGDAPVHAPVDPDMPLRIAGPDRLTMLRALERRILWLSTWMIHHANHLRANVDGLKVGGHQASSASVATLMTALYMDVLRPSDRVAVKPHASPVFHAIQYLLGRQTREKIERFRAFGGAQSYPSRTRDTDDVDISTGSVGLGVAMTTFAALVRDYLDAHEWLRPEGRRGRMVAVVGDAELDEGNVYEALLEGWKHDVRDLWWVVDYNRQSLDAVISDRLFGRFNRLFASMGWDVVTIKYGRKLHEAFARPGGEALRQWIDACPNSLYSALVVKGGAAWRERLLDDIGARRGVRALVSEYDDGELGALMTNLGGHDMESVLEAFEGAAGDRPTCFLAYTIKGYGLPFAGHKDNHSGLMSPNEMEAMRASHGVAPGEEWEPFAGLDVPEPDIRRFLAGVPFNQWVSRRPRAAAIPVPDAETIAPRRVPSTSTQETFGRALDAIARAGGPLADRIVTTSPDVTVSTSLGGWVNRRRLFHRKAREDMFSKEQVGSFQRWVVSPRGQHVELGIAEHNLFLTLAAPACPLAVRRAPHPHRDRLRPVHRARARRVQLRALPGRPLHPRRDPVRHHPGAGGRRAPVDHHAPDRGGQGPPVIARAGLRGRAAGHPPVGVPVRAVSWPAR